MLTDSIKQILNEMKGNNEEPLIVILDFTLVVAMDSSAAHAVAKLKSILHRLFKVEVTIFVSGGHRHGFPCEYPLTETLATEDESQTVDFNKIEIGSDSPAQASRGSICVSRGSKSMKATQLLREMPKNRVCASLDEALQFAEDILIARENPLLMQVSKFLIEDEQKELTSEEEVNQAAKYLEKLALTSSVHELEATRAASAILTKCYREEFQKDDIIWLQGAESDSMKLLLSGKLVASLEGSHIVELVRAGSMVGELGLVQGMHLFHPAIQISYIYRS